jgi:Gpi18-like mannosyltransferase
MLSSFLFRIRQQFLRHELLLALALVVPLIIGSVFLGHENNKVIPVSASSIAHYNQEPSNWLSFMADWDSPNYLYIATNGYSDASLTNFFPLYPLTIHLVTELTISPLDSALAISWISLVGATYFYIKIVKKLFNVTNNLEAIRGVVFFLIFPSAVFLLAAYTESLFALFALAAIYFALRKRYLLAASGGLLATATHITGVFVVVLVAMMLWEEKQRLRKIAISVLVGSLGLVSYMVYLFARFRNPFEFITAQQAHGWLEQSKHSPDLGIGWLNVIFIVLIVLSVIYWWNRRRSLSIYSLLFLAIPVIGGQFGGFNRYLLMAFPVQLMLYGKIKDSTLAYPICIGLSAVLWAYFLFQYTGGYVGG